MKSKNSEQMHCVTFSVLIDKKYKKQLNNLYNKTTDYKNKYIEYVWEQLNIYAEKDEKFKKSLEIIQEQNKQFGKSVNKNDLDKEVQESYDYAKQVFKEENELQSFDEMQKNFMKSSDVIYKIYLADDTRNYACKNVNHGFKVMFNMFKDVKTLGKNVKTKDYNVLSSLQSKPTHPKTKETNEINESRIQGSLRIVYKDGEPYLQMRNIFNDNSKMKALLDLYDEKTGTYLDGTKPKLDSIEFKMLYNKKDKLQKQIVENKYTGCTKLTRVYKKGEWRYYVQINFDGISPNIASYNFDNQKVAININTEMVAVVREDGSQEILELSPDSPRVTEKINKLEMYMDNSRRVTNPDYYLEDGRIKYKKEEMKEKGLYWNYSNGYRLARKQRRELYRLLRVERKRFNDTLAKYILQSGNMFYMDRNQYMAWQMKICRMNKKSTEKYDNGIRKANDYAKQIQTYAPGYFHARIESVCKQLQLPYHEVKSFKSSNYNHFTQQEDLFIELNKRFVTFIKDEDFKDDKVYNETALQIINTFDVIEHDGKRYILQRDLYACSKLLFLSKGKAKRIYDGKEKEVEVDVFDQKGYSKWFDEVFYPKHLEYLTELINKYNLNFAVNGLILGTK